MDQSYDDHINEALSDVNGGLHLRYINYIYRTKEVCLAAIKYQSNYSMPFMDIGSVPVSNLDYVIDNMRIIMNDDQYYLIELEKNYKERKEAEKQQGYYYPFSSAQERLNHYQVDNHDDMLRKMYDEKKLL